MLGNIFWMIYLSLLGTVAVGYLLKGKYKTTLAKVDFIISIITWLGLFGYVTDTSMLTPLFWKFVFFGGLLWDFIYGVFLNDYYGEEIDQDIPVFVRHIITVIILVIFIGPLYYGLYQYAF
ncbi:MAG TPA: hypothetical protein VNM69_09745 [Bacillus sp. (in: firmicutes)]|uniref:hypothetical protein n=1 Tax=Bacillus litorisediminis TaxID=2922713 RepID=UPI001FAD2FD0|nr:hypothetical protein [Bacillus litorisediminis]HWO76159.1 hypothetical protein [Bacillus sp. (in: firmicutes)]